MAEVNAYTTLVSLFILVSLYVLELQQISPVLYSCKSRGLFSRDERFYFFHRASFAPFALTLIFLYIVSCCLWSQ